jgi:prolyl oligopeptidase
MLNYSISFFRVIIYILGKILNISRMKKVIIALVIVVFSVSAYTQTKLNYPDTKKVSHVDNYFGTKVEDDYQWMENLESPDVKEWVTAENKVTFDYLSKIPYRDKIRDRLTKLWNYTKYSAPFKKGEYYYFYKNEGLQNQSVLYRQISFDSEPEIFLDPNTFSTDGTVSLQTITFSRDAKYCAYGISKAGSDWNEYFVMDVATKTKLNDHLKWIKFSGASWLGDGFFYERYNEPVEGKELSSKNESPKIFFHNAGTEQQDDILIYEDKDNPDHFTSIYTSEDEKYMFMSSSKVGADGNMLLFKRVGEGDFKTINDDYDISVSPVNNTEDEMFLTSNKNAPKSKLVKFSLTDSDVNIKDVIPETENVLSSVELCGNKLITVYSKDVTDRIYIFNLAGNFEKEIKLPSLGTSGISVSNKNDNDFFYVFTSFVDPPTIFQYSLINNESTVFKKAAIDFKSDDYVTKQVFYPSKDGTNIPMFIIYKKGIELNGKNPTWLYAYGGFQYSLQPGFSVSRTIFLENNGIVAFANLRGGSEYGDDWHKAGMLEKKQNVFDDFIAAAEYLINNKYTSSKKLAIEGASNGGLLIGAVMNQRPELFRVALPMVGVMDMLKFQKFTIGWAWVTEYGSSDDAAQFKTLYVYSPLHNIKKNLNYPATMIFTSDHDDRVVPVHSFKYTAKLQETYQGDNPIIIRIETNAGHGFGRPVKKIIDEETDKWAFTFYNLGVTPVY